MTSTLSPVGSLNARPSVQARCLVSRIAACGAMALACLLAVASPASAQSVVMVSSLSETESGAQPVNQVFQPSAYATTFAQSFTTGGAAVYLDSITLKMTDNNPQSTGSFGYGFSVTLHEADLADAIVVPGEFLTQLVGSDSPLESGPYHYAAPGQIVLAANTTYFWLAWVQPDGLDNEAQFNVATTASTAEASDWGWTVGESAMIYVGTEDGEGEWAGIGAAALFSVNATAIPEPSTAGVLAGLMVLGTAAGRRRARTA